MNVGKSYVMRLSKYRNALRKFRNIGFMKVFSDNLADSAGVTSMQVRKDFSLFGLTGNKKGGYNLDELSCQIDKLLGKDQLQPVIIIGAGKIGMALVNYRGFDDEGIKIVAAFDADRSKTDQTAQVPIFHIDDLKNYLHKNKVNVAIIAVPEAEAQKVSDLLALEGIKGILNFAPVHIRCKEDVVVNNINVRIELENVIYYVNAMRRAKGKK